MLGTVTNNHWIFKENTHGLPIPGQTVVYTSETLDLDNIPLQDGILVKVLVISVEVYYKALMMFAYKKDQTTYSYGIAKVVRSDNSNFQVGDIVAGVVIPHAEYGVLPRFLLEKVSALKGYDGVPLTAHVGVLGMPGMTAFGGWRQYSRGKKGDTLFVSSGASTVGQLVCQLAKLEGLRVIASAGSDDKVKFLEEIGVDVPFNYKTTSIREVLKKEGPVNIYWDNVGGDTLDAALENMAMSGQILVCGGISGLDTGSNPVNSFFQVIVKQISIQGMLVSTYEKKYEKELREYVAPKVASGVIKFSEDKRQGLDKTWPALVDIFQGKNTGKALVIVAEE